MEKKEKQQQKATKGKKQEELLKTLGDFTSKENWDQFFTIRGSDDSFEWYAEWPQLQSLLTTHLLESAAAPRSALQAAEVSILVPGCGNSKLSEHLYDAGFRNITNVDFSKVVISDMLRRNVRERPGMKWRVMDMTSMQVKRLLKAGGKFICLTLAESHVLGLILFPSYDFSSDLLFPKFRFGWKMSLYAIAQEPSSRSLKLQTFMVVAEKDISSVVSEISCSWMDILLNLMARQLYEALEREQKVRKENSNGSDILYSLEDLNLGAKGNLTELEPGRRIKLILGEPGVSRFIYNGVLLDAQPDSGPFSYHFGVFLVPKMRAHEWLFSAEEGQWLLVVSAKAARLVMILLDSINSNAAMEDIQKDLSPLVKQLAPRDCDDGNPIPNELACSVFLVAVSFDLLELINMNLCRFMAASDGITQREIVHQVTSALTGPIVVDDVIYEQFDDDLNRDSLSKELIFRRLTFQRTESLVQSEALLSKEGSNGISTSSGEMKVDHNYLASSYHNGIISGLMLISLHLKGSISAGGMIQTVVIGLGAGLLPMFMKNCLPSLMIEVVELDPVVLDVAREYFGFREDERLKVHITDGIKFVRRKQILRQVFSNLFSLQLEEDVNEVIFALKTDSPINIDQLSSARNALATMLDSEKQEWGQKVIDASKLIKPLS
ncbi:hypothetical protein DH2020_043371 [Rehmannia glutinosa]|uniref:Methyltransferase type 11 domain-containing protein n=1 Tax=Rehmannia glutinosa TaxID=99300 RepID=A0ABR0UL34_REHGL